MQAESGVQMESTHKCRKTNYVKSRDGNIHAIKSDALIVPSLKQDPIQGRSVTKGLDPQVILEKNTDICGIYPRNNSKLYGDEITTSFLSDDLRLYRTKKPHLKSAAKVNRQPLNKLNRGSTQGGGSIQGAR